MTIQLRQICLVAAELEPAITNLTTILGIQPCFVDPGVGKFGLENTLMPVGHNFLEVVAPIENNTAAGRYLQRRGGDGGYMVITQADSAESQQQVRQNALDNGVRIAHESIRDDWHLCQLHPGDMQAAFLEIESDAYNNFDGYWHPVGGLGWQDKVDRSVTLDFCGVELQSNDPVALAELWGKVAGLPVAREGDSLKMSLNNADIRFVETQDNRGAGLGGIDIKVANRSRILEHAEAAGCYVDDHRVDICGTRWYLI